MKTAYSREELLREVAVLRGTFDLVRVIDPVGKREYPLPLSAQQTMEGLHKCCTLSQSDENCISCVCRDALVDKTRYTKFEFVDHEIYHVLAKFIHVDGVDYVLELITKIQNGTFLNAYGVNDFVERITKYNQNIYTDELTHVYNRRYLNEKGTFLLKQAIAEDANLGLAIIDIDNLKPVNDQFGHLMGDQAIMAVANLLQSNISSRRGDVVVRFGGDEFIVLFRNIERHIFIDRLQLFVDRAREFLFAETKNIHLSLSIGGAFSNELDAPQMNDLIELADQRLYQAKAHGKSCYIV